MGRSALRAAWKRWVGECPLPCQSAAFCPTSTCGVLLLQSFSLPDVPAPSSRSAQPFLAECCVSAARGYSSLAVTSLRPIKDVTNLTEVSSLLVWSKALQPSFPLHFFYELIWLPLSSLPLPLGCVLPDNIISLQGCYLRSPKMASKVHCYNSSLASSTHPVGPQLLNRTQRPGSTLPKHQMQSARNKKAGTGSS